MNNMDVFGRIEIIKAYVLKEFLVRKIEKLDITNILTMMHLGGDNFSRCNLEVKNGIASFFTIYEEITDLVEIYDLSRSYEKMKDMNNTYLEIFSTYQEKLNGPINIEIFGKNIPYMQLKNLMLLGEVSMTENGFVVFDDKDYKKIIEDVVNDYNKEQKDNLDTILGTLKNGDVTS